MRDVAVVTLLRASDDVEAVVEARRTSGFDAAAPPREAARVAVLADDEVEALRRLQGAAVHAIAGDGWAVHVRAGAASLLFVPVEQPTSDRDDVDVAVRPTCARCDVVVGVDGRAFAVRTALARDGGGLLAAWGDGATTRRL